MPKDYPLAPFTAATAIPTLLQLRKDPNVAENEDSPNQQDSPSPADTDMDYPEQQPRSPGETQLESASEADGRSEEQLGSPDEADAQARHRSQAEAGGASPNENESPPSAFPHAAAFPSIGFDTGMLLTL